MKEKDHLEKAKRLEKSAELLDVDENWEAIIELLYGAALHYIACICEKRKHTHMDTHKNLPSFLVNSGLPELAELFREFDRLRLGHWYGGQGNGVSVARAKEIIARIKEEL